MNAPGKWSEVFIAHLRYGVGAFLSEKGTGMFLKKSGEGGQLPSHDFFVA